MCVVISFILDVRLVGVPAGVTQVEGHTGFLRLPSAVLDLIFLAGKIQPFISLIDRGFDLLCTDELINRSPFAGHFSILYFYFFVRKNPSSLT